MENIKQQLNQLADGKYKEFHGSLCPGTNNIIGVRVPVLRQYAKELLKKYSIEEIFKDLDNEYYEEILLKGMLIGLAKLDLETRIKYMREFIPQIDNWAVCDITCAGLKFIKNNQTEIWEFIQKYLKSNREFEIRFAVVIMLDFYINEQYIDKILKELDKINHSGYYVKMAVAWAISICYIKFSDKTHKYLQQNNLDDFTYNKAIQKTIESYRVSDNQKQILRKMKR